MKEAIVWIDAEFSGTSPQADELLEIAAIVTDLSGNTIGYPFEALFGVTNLSEVISRSSEIVRDMHDKSGLWFDLWSKNSDNFQKVEERMLEWLSDQVSDDVTLYFGGNSITKDRNYVEIHLPLVYSRISHQSVDVTSLAIALKANSKASSFSKEHRHRALSDIHESVQEYRHYVKFVTKLEQLATDSLKKDR